MRAIQGGDLTACVDPRVTAGALRNLTPDWVRKRYHISYRRATVVAAGGSPEGSATVCVDPSIRSDQIVAVDPAVVPDAQGHAGDVVPIGIRLRAVEDGIPASVHTAVIHRDVVALTGRCRNNRGRFGGVEFDIAVGRHAIAPCPYAAVAANRPQSFAGRMRRRRNNEFGGDRYPRKATVITKMTRANNRVYLVIRVAPGVNAARRGHDIVRVLARNRGDTAAPGNTPQVWGAPQRRGVTTPR